MRPVRSRGRRRQNPATILSGFGVRVPDGAQTLASELRKRKIFSLRPKRPSNHLSGRRGLERVAAAPRHGEGHRLVSRSSPWEPSSRTLALSWSPRPNVFTGTDAAMSAERTVDSSGYAGLSSWARSDRSLGARAVGQTRQFEEQRSNRMARRPGGSGRSATRRDCHGRARMSGLLERDIAP